MPGRVYVLNAPSAPSHGGKMTYRNRWAYADFAYAPIVRVPNVDRVTAYVVAVEHPASVEVTFDVFAPQGEVAYAVRQPRPERTEIRFEDLDPLTDLPLFPHNGYHAAVLPKFAGADGPTLHTRPADFAVWYRDLTRQAMPDTLSTRLRDLAASLQREPEAETVAAIHDYARGAIRYVADERAESDLYVPTLVFSVQP